MIYLLDTNVVIALLRDRPASVRTHLRQALANGDSLTTSTVVLYELWYGVARSEHKRENAERLRVFLSGDISMLPFDEDAAVAAGDLRATLEASGAVIGPYDLLIAGQALAHARRLVTANVAEFARVPNLSWEDWST